MVLDTLGVTADDQARLPIHHVIVVMKENRSFDQLFGKLYQHGQPDAEPLPDDAANLDSKGVEVHPWWDDHVANLLTGDAEILRQTYFGTAVLRPEALQAASRPGMRRRAA